MSSDPSCESTFQMHISIGFIIPPRLTYGSLGKNVAPFPLL